MISTRICNFLLFGGGPRFCIYLLVFSKKERKKERTEVVRSMGGWMRGASSYAMWSVHRHRKLVLSPTCSWTGVCTMFIGYSLQATLEQINRKGLLQGRMEDVRVYSGQGMRRTSVRCFRDARSASGCFLISLSSFFLDSLLLLPRLSFNESRSRDVAFDLSSTLTSAEKYTETLDKTLYRDYIWLLLHLLPTEQKI